MSDSPDSYLARMQRSSHLAGGNVAYIEELFERYLEDPNDVPEEWRGYFEKLPRVADSLTVETPRNAILALRRIRESGGAGVYVPDDDIVADIARLARTTGVFAEPAAAAALSGLRAALDSGSIGRDERVVLLITGSGLKDVPAAERAIRIPEPVAADLDAVVGFLDRGGRM